jgi:hypothetical protein
MSGIVKDNEGRASGLIKAASGGGGAVSWQTDSIKTANFSAEADKGYFADTSGGAFTMTLPSGSAGSQIAVVDYTNSFNTYNLTIAPQTGEKIGGIAANTILSTVGISVNFIYIDSTEGWKLISDATSNTTGYLPFMTATGGTITEDGDYKVHTFTSSGTFTVTAVGQDSTYGNKVEYLVVGAGAGGGSSHGGGGGAGGYRHNSAYDFTVTAQAYSITVAAKVGLSSGGGVSTFSTITSAGGGQGGGDGGGDSAAQAGGSGGGGQSFPSPPYSGGNGNTPSVSPSQGSNGGSSSGGSPNYGAAGGGGAGGTGGSGNSGSAGSGGNGSSNDIHGSSRVYSAGGGGHAHGGSAGGGSSNQGGSSASLTTGGYNVSGAYGMGGGANQGGTISGAPATGNSSQGVVIIRYKFQ